jgi:tRNA A37 methylthiotransferase MiaB
MSTISFLEKKKDNIQNVVVVFPFTYVNPYNAMPPVAAEYLQAGILATGRNAILLDMRFEIDIREHLESADLVCLYGHFEDCSMFVKRDIHVINEVLDQIPAHTPIVAGGTNFNDPEKAFSKFPKVDVIILENPETCIRELLDSEDFESVTNIAYQNNGQLIKTQRIIHPLPEDIYPNRKVRNPKYKYHAIGIPIDLVRAGIGCNYQCNFCYQYGKDFDGSFRRWQGRSAQSLFNEMQEIEAPLVGWVDDDMTAGMKALDELSGMLIANGIQKLFAGTGRIDHVNRYVEKNGTEVLKRLEKAGLLALSFGVESLNPKTLKFYNKGQSLASIEKAMRLMNKTNILLVCNFIFGSPGETEADMMDMLWFGRKWNVDTVVTNRMGFPEDSDIHRAIYDENGNFRPGMEMITGKELERIKYNVKFGQRTPFRILLSLLKLYRHRGMFLDPTYLFCCALETLTQKSWLEKTRVFPWILKITKRIVVVPWVRQVLRVLAIIATPPAKLLNWLFELIDKPTGLSTKLLPRFFLYLTKGMYKRQVAQAQVRSTN